MKPVSMSFETGFIVLFIGTLGASTEQNVFFAFNIAPFFVFLSPKKEVRLTLNSKKTLSNFKRALLDNGQDAPETASRRSCHCVGM